MHAQPRFPHDRYAADVRVVVDELRRIDDGLVHETCVQIANLLGDRARGPDRTGGYDFDESSNVGFGVSLSLLPLLSILIHYYIQVHFVYFTCCQHRQGSKDPLLRSVEERKKVARDRSNIRAIL